MKKFISFWLMVLSLAVSGFAQNLTTFSESFEDEMFPPEGWVLEGDDWYKWERGKSKNATDGNYVAKSPTTESAQLTTPLLQPQTGESLKFDMMAAHQNDELSTLVVKIKKEGDDDFTELASFAMADYSSEMSEIEIPLTDYIGEQVYIQFDYQYDDPDYTYTEGGVYIDNVTGVSWQPITCHKLVDGSLSVSNVTTSSVTVTWQNYYEADGYNIQYVQLTDQSDEPDWTSPMTASSTDTFALITVEAGKIYAVRVQAACSGDMTSGQWIDYVTFFTPMDYVTLPNTSDPSEGWGAWFPYKTSYNEWDGYTPKIEDGWNGVYYLVGVSDKADTGILASAVITEDMNNIRMTFVGKSLAYYKGDAQTLTVGVMSDPSDISTFESVKEIPWNTESQKYIIDFDNAQVSSNANHVAFMVTTNSDWAQATSGWQLDKITLQTIPSCKGPVENSLHISDVTSNEITVAWQDDNADNSSWIVYVQNLSDEDAELKEISVYDTVLTINDLNPASLYKIWVATLCGNEVSEDVCTPVKVYTMSETVISSFPYANDFEDESKNKDFSNIVIEDGLLWTIGSAVQSDIVEDGQDPDENTNSMYVSMDDGLTNTLSDEFDTYGSLAVVTALNVEFGDMPQYDISFDYNTYTDYSYDNAIRVYAVDDDVALTYDNIWNEGTNLVKNINKDDLASEGWTHVTIPVFNVANKKMNIVFVNTVDPSYMTTGAAIDNLHIGEPICTKPQNFKVKDLTSTDIALSWQTELTPDIYHVYYAIDSTDENEEPMPENVIDVNDTTVRFSEQNVTLLPNTAYRVYVQGDCGNDGISIKSEEIKFVTPCGSEIVSLPYQLTFANDAEHFDQAPDCWIANYSDEYDRFYIRSRQHNAGDWENPVYWSDTVLSANAYYSYSYAILPKFADTMNLSQIKVSFDSITSNGFDLGFVSNTADMSTFEKVASVPASNWSYASSVFSYTGEKRYLAIRLTMGYGNDFTARSIEVGYPTDCETPTNLTADNVASTSVDLKWQRVSENMSSFTVYYKEYASDDDYSAITAAITTSGNDVTYTLNGLKGGTQYELYIAPTCNEDLKTPVISFETECADITTAPFVYDFSLGTHYGGEYPDTLKCWTLNSVKGQKTNSYYGDIEDIYVPYSDTWSGLYLYLPDSVLDNKTLNDISIVTPTFTNDIKDVMFTLTYSVEDSLAGRLLVGALTDPSDMTTFDSLGYIDLLSDHSYEEHYVLFADYEGNAHNLALRFSENVPLSDGFDYGIGIKYMAVDTLPACPAPMKFAVVSTNENSVTLTWKALKPDQTNFVVQYQAVSGLGASDNSWQSTPATLNTIGQFTVNNLAPNTVYQFIVAPECAEGSDETFDAVKGMTTPAIDPVALPYEPDFSDLTEASSWYTPDYDLDNHWYFGAINGLNDNYLYLSAKAGDSVYNCKSSTFAVAERLLAMTEADTIDVDFDLTVYGDGTYHALALMLVPDSISLISSSDSYAYSYDYDYDNYCFDFIDFTDIDDDEPLYWMSTEKKEGVQRDFHIKGQMVNPNKNGNAKLLFIWKNDSYNEPYPYGPRISNLSVKEYTGPLFKVVTEQATSVSDKSATLYATMDVDAQYTLAAKGFEYKASAATDYTKVDVIGDNFVYTLNGLVPETEYTFRAFIAKNITDTTFDTVYGAELTFTTLEEQIVIVDPTVQTATPNAVWTDAATLVANVTPGTKDINEYGFEYRLASAGDDTYQSKIGTVNNTTITATITGLEVNTMYTVRGYVKTEDGTFYGNVITFSTNDTTIIDDTSSIAELSNNVTISMYPNPTSDNAVLTINGLNGAAKVILTDVQGRIIEESEIALGEDTMTINTASLESGVYYVRIVANGILRTEKLIKK